MKQWHVVQVRPGFELAFANTLGKEESFCPPERIQWVSRGKARTRDRAIFANYVITTKNPHNPYAYHEVAAINGFNRFIPGAPISDETLDIIREMLGEDGFYNPKPLKPTKFKSGDVLSIVNGPYAGHTAICESHHGEKITAKAALLSGEIKLYMRSAQCILAESGDAAVDQIDVVASQRKFTRRQRQRFSRRLVSS